MIINKIHLKNGYQSNKCWPRGPHLLRCPNFLFHQSFVQLRRWLGRCSLYLNNIVNSIHMDTPRKKRLFITKLIVSICGDEYFL